MVRVVLVIILFFLSTNIYAQQSRKIDIAFLLDLSGSTNGLLNDFRNNYYFMLNELQSMKPAPEVRFAIITYGRPSFGKKNNYVKITHDFTVDFDKIQYDLIQLKTSIERGNQYVGDALITAIRDLSWTKDAGAIKIIYLIGNGMTNTNIAIDNKRVAEEAVSANIKINTLYVFSGKKFPQEMIGWKTIAENANGTYTEAAINRKQPNPQLVTNYNRLDELNNVINSTLVTYLVNGNDMLEMHREIDRYHRNAGAHIFEDRVYYKTTGYFENSVSSWDLISAGYKKFIDVSKINKEFLPDKLQDADVNELKRVINNKRVQRTRAKNEAAALLGGRERQSILNEKLLELELNNTNAIARVIVNSLRGITEQNGIKNP